MPGMPQAQAETHDLPLQLREAQIEPATFNESTNEVEVVWTTGARVRRFDYWNDTPYEEELVVDAESVDMARFEAGTVQVLDGHRSYGGVAAILGVATRGWIEGGVGRATLRLSQRPELAGIVADIRAGVIRAISFGYSVRRYEITRATDRDDGVNMPLYRATSWQPQEISFVPVPADPNAGTRSQPSQSLARCEFVRAAAQPSQENPMPNPATETQQGGTPATPTQAEIDAQRSAAEAAVAQRAADITDLCTRHGAPQLAAQLIRDGRSVDQARAAVLEDLARRDAAAGGHRNVRVETVSDEVQTRMAGMQEAVMNRLNTRSELTDNGRQFRGMSMLELCRDFLELRGVNTRGMDRMRIASEALHFRSMHTTSDFSNLLANVASKRLRNAYDENTGTYSLWARRAPNAPDFKNMSVVQLSAMPNLLQTNEHGEFKYGGLSDGAETYAMLTYGRIVALSRQAIVNDDLRGFDRLVTGYGFSARRLENATVYSQLTANAALSDSVALFHATHTNLATGGGSALAATSLQAMRTAMRKQVGLQSEVLNLVPVDLIVPAALEETAYQLTSAQYQPATKAEINEFRSGGRTALRPIVEPILDANSATAWYAAASNTQVDTIEYCYLDGAEGPVIEQEMGFEVDGMQLKCRLDFAAKAIDFRGLYKGAGA